MGNIENEDQETGLLSFAVPPFVDPWVKGSENKLPEGPENPAAKKDSIWDTLREAIQRQVRKDIRGAGKKRFQDSIQPYETADQVEEDAVSQIYHDVAEFYAWYFNPDDDRAVFIRNQKPVDLVPSLREAVVPVVDDNLDAMREIDEIPPGQDTADLDDKLSDTLTRYIVNWQDWYYDRKEEEAVDNYFEQASVYEDTYIDDSNDGGGSYGDLTNILDDGQFDGVSDVPYIAEE